jgi:hypothetical protein
LKKTGFQDIVNEKIQDSEERMQVKVPLEFEEYTSLLLIKGYAGSESGVIQRLVEDGLLQVLLAISQDGLGDPEREMEFFRNCETNSFEIADDFKGSSKIEALCHRLGYPKELTMMALIYAGLITEGYYFLRHDVPEYETNLEYRTVVDEMPHDSDFESRRKVPEKKFVMPEDKELTIHMIH